MNLTIDSHGNLPIEDYFPDSKRRQIHVAPEGGFFDHKDFRAAARRARTGDCIFIPTGEFPTEAFTRSVEIAGLHGSHACLIPENNRIQISADVIFFRGLTLGREVGPPLKIEISRGLAVFMDCQIHGEIEVEGAQTEVALTRCRLTGGTIGIQLKKGAAAILHSTAVENYATGIRAEDHSQLDIRFGRFSRCRTGSPETPGLGILATKGALKIIGTRFVENDVALTLHHPVTAEILNSSFSSQNLSSLKIEGLPESGTLRIANGKFQPTLWGDSAQILSIESDLTFENCEFASATPPTIHSQGGRLTLRECRLNSTLQTENTELRVENSQLHSASRALEISGDTFQLQGCVIDGEIHENGQRLEGLNSPHFSDCRPFVQTPASSEPAPLNEFLHKLAALAGLTEIKPQAEKILRELHSAANGQSANLTPLRLLMAGDSGTGRFTLTELLIQAFVRYGVLNQSHVIQCSFHDLFGYDEPGLRLLAESARGGTLLIRRNAPVPPLPEPQRRLIPDRRLKLKRLHDLIGNQGAIIVHGDKTLLRQLLAGAETLRPIFRSCLEFVPYSAAELASIAMHLCRSHHLTVSDECALKLNIGFHVTQDRKDRRFQNAAGAEALFRTCQTRHLERLSQADKMAADLLPADIRFPYDRAIAEILNSSPAFEAKCPHCETLNPWQIGLPKRLNCQACGQFFYPETGTWMGRHSELDDDEEAPQPEPRQRFTHRRIADIT